MIEVDRLSKTYGSFQALKDVSFRVERGEVAGFLGPNGAGKSTTLRIVAGFLGASEGDVTIDGHSISREPLLAKSRLGYMPEAAPLYGEMRVSEYLSYRAELKRLGRSERASAVGRVIEDAGLAGMERVVISQLSKGYRQRVGLADALVASPPLLVLDEPTAGLDPNQIRDVRALIARLKERHTILVSTHILSEVEAICTRGIVINRGKLVAQGTLAELRALQRPPDVHLRLRGTRSIVKDVLSKVEGAGEVSFTGVERKDPDQLVPVVVTFEDPSRADQITERIVAALTAAKVGVVESTLSSSLEQVFADLTTAAPTKKKKSSKSVTSREKNP